MCYSAQILAEYRKFEREFGAVMDIRQYVRFFWERRRDGGWRKVPKRLKDAFANPRNDAERRIQGIIAEGDADARIILSRCRQASTITTGRTTSTGWRRSASG